MSAADRIIAGADATLGGRAAASLPLRPIALTLLQAHLVASMVTTFERPSLKDPPTLLGIRALPRGPRTSRDTEAALVRDFMENMHRLVRKDKVGLSPRVILAAIQRYLGRETSPLYSEQAAALAEEIADGQAELDASNERYEILLWQRGLLKMGRDRTEAMHVATAIWGRTYKLGKTDDQVADECLILARDTPRETVGHLDGMSVAADVEDGPLLRLAVAFAFLAKWAHCAFPILQCAHTYAAALACTDTYPEVFEGFRPPWPALRVQLPTGLIPVLDTKALTDLRDCATEEDRRVLEHASLQEVSHADLFQHEAGPACLLIYTRMGLRLAYLEAATLGELLSAGIDGDALPATHAVRRIVAGLLLAMQVPGSSKERSVQGRRSNPRDRGEPGHRLVVVGSPITVDARPALAAYLAGEPLGHARRRTGVGALQWLVRGHWRRQAHGPKRGLRRLTWIEPHWAGSADGQIISKPKVVTGGRE